MRCTIGCFILPVDIVVKNCCYLLPLGLSESEVSNNYSVCIIFVFIWGLEIHAAELLQVQMSSAVLQER